MLGSTGVSVRTDFRRTENQRRTMFLDMCSLNGTVEDAHVETDTSAFDCDGDLSASFFRSGLEFAFLLGPEGRYELGFSFGMVSGLSLDFDYYDAGNPEWRQITDWAPTFFILSPGISLRTRINQYATFKAEASISLAFLSSHVAECAVGLELRYRGLSLTPGWRFIDTHAGVWTAAEILKMDFHLSGPTVVFGYTF